MFGDKNLDKKYKNPRTIETSLEIQSDSSWQPNCCPIWREIRNPSSTRTVRTVVVDIVPIYIVGTTLSESRIQVGILP